MIGTVPTHTDLEELESGYVRVNFYFENSEELEDAEERYFTNDLVVEARAFSQAIRLVKNEINVHLKKRLENGK